MLADGGLLVLGLRAPFRRPIAWANRSPRDVRPIRLNPRKSIVALAERRPGPCLRHRWIIGRMPGLAAILGDQHAPLAEPVVIAIGIAEDSHGEAAIR